MTDGKLVLFFVASQMVIDSLSGIGPSATLADEDELFELGPAHAVVDTPFAAMRYEG